MSAIMENSRGERGRALYEAGAVDVLEERLRKSTLLTEGTPPSCVEGGVYRVQGSQGNVYIVEAQRSTGGVILVGCGCEDYLRGADARTHNPEIASGVCKHCHAVVLAISERSRELGIGYKVRPARLHQLPDGIKAERKAEREARREAEPTAKPASFVDLI